jgi:hypothetical protein
MGANLSKQSFTEGNPKLQTFVRECQKGRLAKVDTTTVEIWLSELMKPIFIVVPQKILVRLTPRSSRSS